MENQRKWWQAYQDRVAKAIKSVPDTDAPKEDALRREEAIEALEYIEDPLKTDDPFLPWPTPNFDEESDNEEDEEYEQVE